MTGLPTPSECLELLNREARRHAGKSGRPVDAATLIILDRTGREPRLLMGRRHKNHRFMPDVFVFPGGRSETGDAHVPVAGMLDEATIQRLMLASPGANPSRMKRLALAAIRETFEETGIVIGRKAGNSPPLAGPWGEFTATGHLPDLSALAYIARAITPPRRPKRFDTRFFVVESTAIAHQVPDIVTPDSELTELAWLTLDDTKDLPLPVITRVMLGELQGWIEARATGTEPAIPFYCERHGRMERNLI